MAKPSLLQQFTFKEVQLVVREAPSIPAKLKPFVGVHFNSSLQVFRILSDLKSMDVETFLCLHLDCKNTVRALQVVSIGSLGSSLVHPREVFRSAILNGAAGVIFAHNHPSGDPAPPKRRVVSQGPHRNTEVGVLCRERKFFRSL